MDGRYPLGFFDIGAPPFKTYAKTCPLRGCEAVVTGGTSAEADRLMKEHREAHAASPAFAFLPPTTWDKTCPIEGCGEVIEADTPSEVMRLMQEHQEADHGHCDSCGYECRCDGGED